MAPKKYALEPLADLRRVQVDEAAHALTAVVREREAAEAKAHEANATKARAAEEAAAARAIEQAKLEAGELTAADLMRAAAHAVAVHAETARLDGAVAAAERRADEARLEERSAQALLGARKASKCAVDRDRARWEGRERTRSENQEDEEALEAWRGTRG